jgi:hypothetical protein
VCASAGGCVLLSPAKGGLDVTVFDKWRCIAQRAWRHMAASNAGLGDIAAATGPASYDDPSRTGLLGENADDQLHADFYTGNRDDDDNP